MALTDILTAYRVALVAAPASLLNMPASVRARDLPTSTLHRVFKLTLARGPIESIPGPSGAGGLDLLADLRLEIHWTPGLDEEAISNTIATDCENALFTMLDASTRPTGVRIVSTAQPFTPNDDDTDDFYAVSTFTVRYRTTQDLT